MIKKQWLFFPFHRSERMTLLQRLTMWLFTLVFLLLGVGGCDSKPGTDTQTLTGKNLTLQWRNSEQGWQLDQLDIHVGDRNVSLSATSAEYTLLYSAIPPDSTPMEISENGKVLEFPEPIYRYNTEEWGQITQPVAMNQAGEALTFFPAFVERHPQDEQGGKDKKGALVFKEHTERADIEAQWQIDEQYDSDVRVRLTVTARTDGYFSVATPTLATVAKSELAWGAIPGHFQGADINDSLVHSLAYGQGIPDRPVLVRERTATTLAPMLSTQSGVTLAVIPEPGTGRDPWEQDHMTQHSWQLGLSLMNRQSQLTPKVWHPVLGEKGSFLKKGESVQFEFRYSVQMADWFSVYRHAVENIYRFDDFLALKRTRQSLTDRILSMHDYLRDDTRSKWRTEIVEGVTLGAQAYLGGVLNSDRDAMKNSDYGAMWMLARIMDDPVLKETRLPYARNFKLLQQQSEPGFYHGAAKGQYFLSKSKTFTEEWGDYVEPIAITYYTLVDIGNILLFEPDDEALKQRLRDGAERLLAWQRPTGNWAVAYDHTSEKPLFTELEDLRPTFYGLVVAYRILGDERYLRAAQKGADWYIQNAVNTGHFLGVCGDNRFVPDFATGQSAQALLDLYELTDETRYLDAAKRATQLYTQSIYTHPVPDTTTKKVHGVSREDWEISQVGLSNEHGGGIGSANDNGPILLASHAGLFVRMYQLTGETLYVHMARAAALGRDAFVDSDTSTASYYWQAMDAGPGAFPHHAWWQIGWITDYLLAEAELRSGGQIQFPRGFVTPKVGPHQSYGFAPGDVYGTQASLMLRHDTVNSDNPYVDFYMALSNDGKRLFVFLLNNDDEPQTAQVDVDSTPLLGREAIRTQLLDQNGAPLSDPSMTLPAMVTIPAYGLRTLELSVDDTVRAN